MLVSFLKLLGSATFVEKLESEEGVYFLRFRREADEVIMAWSSAGDWSGAWPVEPERVLDVFGEDAESRTLGEAPVYGVAVR
jgi:hypothetical protein